MFHFSGFRVPYPIFSDKAGSASPSQVTPFGYPRVFAHLQLSEAFRSLLRPSSPVGSKAFSASPSFLFPFLRAVSRARYGSGVPLAIFLRGPVRFLAFFLFFGNCFLPLSWLVLHGSRREALFATRMSIFPSLLLQLPLRLPPSLVGLTGLEPVTPRLSSVCSNQLSYRPIASFPRRTLAWWRHGGSNPGLPACKAGALAN